MSKDATEKAIGKDVDETTFREIAQDIIKKYRAKGMLLDSLLWSRLIGLYDKAVERAYHMQPIVLGTPGAGSADGRPRFKANVLVQRLFEGVARSDLLAKIAAQPDIPIEDKEQFWMMLGYSVDSLCELSWVRQETKDAADLEAARLAVKARGEI